MECKKSKTTVIMTVFFIAMTLCGCSLETFFDGGAPVAILALLVAIACAVVLGSKGGDDNASTD